MNLINFPLPLGLHINCGFHHYLWVSQDATTLAKAVFLTMAPTKKPQTNWVQFKGFTHALNAAITVKVTSFQLWKCKTLN